MPELPCFNIPAHYCTSRFSEHGRRIVQYQGNQYAVIGLYFASRYNENAERTPVYILRAVQDNGQMSSRQVNRNQTVLPVRRTNTASRKVRGVRSARLCASRRVEQRPFDNRAR